MKLTIKKQIGKTVYPFTFEGDNLFDVQMEAQKLSFFDVPKCGECGSDNLYLRAYETEKEKFKYIKIQCGSCKASVTFGQPKHSPNTFYLRKTDDNKLDWQKYDGDEKRNTATPPETRKSAEDDRDLPF